jgi:hypothetical protein
MDLYKQINDIFPFLISIRKLETFVSIDIEIPETWKLIKKYVDEKTVVEQKTNKVGFRCFSFAAEFTESSLEQLFKNINGVIKYNKDKEEKERLFELKVNELKSFFEQKTLNDLKDLQFNIKQELTIKLEDDEEETGEGENDRLVTERNGERQSRVRAK